MVSALFTLATAALLTAGSAAPTTPKSFSVPLIADNKGWKPSGSHQRAKAYSKFNKPMPQELAEAVAAQTGHVTATPGDQYDSEYLSPVTVGAQTLQLDFDTGSSDLWVFSTLLPSGQRGSHRLYNPGSAPRAGSETWRITYGDGSGASGVVYKDKVTIGGATVTSQGVEAATSASSAFVSGPNDGLVGLAFDTINTVRPTQEKTFFTNVAPSLPANLFTADLKYHATGSYDFGFIDSSKYRGGITYTSVNSGNGFWEVVAQGYAVGSSAFVTSSIDGIMDTGTTLLYLPNAVIAAYYRQVSGAQNSATYGGYVFPCSATLPSFTLRFSGYNAVVPGRYINYAPVTDGSSTCYGGIQSNSGIGFSIFGDVFLKSQFVVFDKTTGSPRLGLAAKTT